MTFEEFWKKLKSLNPNANLVYSELKDNKYIYDYNKNEKLIMPDGFDINIGQLVTTRTDLVDFPSKILFPQKVMLDDSNQEEAIWDPYLGAFVFGTLNIQQEQLNHPLGQNNNEQSFVDGSDVRVIKEIENINGTFEILQRRRAMNEEHRRMVRSAIYAGIWILVAAATIIANKDEMPHILSDELQALTSWEMLKEYFKDFEPITIFSIAESLLHTRNYLRHSRRFNDVRNQLLDYRIAARDTVARRKESLGEDDENARTR